MDLLGLGLILLICLVGALVANIADNMGRKIGKSRRTIAGLRPRHTAVLFTSLTGFLLPLLTIITVAFLSHDLRTILREGGKLITARERAEKDLASTQRRSEATRRELQTRTAQVKTLQDQSSKVRGELGQAQVELKTRQQMVSQLQKTTAGLQRNAAELRSRLASLDRATKQARIRIAQEESRNKDLSQRNAELDKSYARQRTEFADLDRERDRLVREVSQLEGQLTKVQRELQQANADTAVAQKNFDEMSSRLNERIETLSGQIRTKEAELANLFEQAAAIAVAPRTERLIVSLNDELSRGTIPAGATIPEAKRLIERLKRGADETARTRGASGAGFVPREAGGKTVAPEDQERSLLDDLINQSTEQVVIFQSIWNVYARELVPIRYTLVPNSVVYGQGTVVAETRIRGDQSEVAILNELTRWLETGLIPKIQGDGMIPSVGRLNRPELISGDELYDLVKEIRMANRQIRVQALAKRQIRKADDPDFEFRLR